MGRLRNAYRSAFIVCIAVALAGCYTLLGHPTTDDGFEPNDFSRCAQCHDGYGCYNFSPYEPFYQDVWWDYYTLPWWYNEVIVGSDNEEVPIRRAIHGMRTIQRDDPVGGAAVGVERTTSGVRARDRKENVESRPSEAGGEKQKVRKKEAPQQKSEGTRKTDGGKRDDGSSENGTERKEQSGGDKNRDKKRTQ